MNYFTSSPFFFELIHTFSCDEQWYAEYGDQYQKCRIPSNGAYGNADKHQKHGDNLIDNSISQVFNKPFHFKHLVLCIS